MPVARARHIPESQGSARIVCHRRTGQPRQTGPDAYLLGAQLLGTASGVRRSEDAPAGVLSGLAAGCHVIAVNAPADTPRLADVDFALDGLTQVSRSAKQQTAMWWC